MSKDLQVNKSNKIIEARYRMTLLEQKFILLVVSLINPDDSNFRFYNLSIKDIADNMGLNQKNSYRDLRKVIVSLNKKVLIIPEEEGELIVSWVASSKYYKKEGRIEFEFSDRLKPYLLQLKREFTTFKLRNIVKLKSAYSIRIYELLKQYEKIGYRKISVDDLRRNMGLENHEYPHFANFHQKVLKVAEEELREKTDISYNLEIVKEGRLVKYLIFHISHQDVLPNKIEYQEKKNEDEKSKKENKEETNIEEIFFKIAKATNSPQVKKNVLKEIIEKEWDFIDEKFRDYVKKSGIKFSEFVLLKAEYVMNQYERDKAAKPIGMLIDAIKNNYNGIDEYVKKKENDREKELISLKEKLEKDKEILVREMNQNNLDLCWKIAEREPDLLRNIINDMKINKSIIIKNYIKIEDPYKIYSESLIIRASINAKIMESYKEMFNEMNKEDTKKIEKINKEIEEVRKSHE